MLPLKRIYCKHHRAATSIMQFSDRQLQRKGSWLIISLFLVPERGKLKKFLRFMCSTLNFQHSCSNTGCVQCIPTDLWYVAFADCIRCKPWFWNIQQSCRIKNISSIYCTPTILRHLLLQECILVEAAYVYLLKEVLCTKMVHVKKYTSLWCQIWTGNLTQNHTQLFTPFL